MLMNITAVQHNLIITQHIICNQWDRQTTGCADEHRCSAAQLNHNTTYYVQSIGQTDYSNAILQE